MNPRPAGHVLVEALVAQGVHTAFGVPGESYLAVLDGFHQHRDQIRCIACRQVRLTKVSVLALNA